MKITLFTSNQPRHMALIEGLARHAHEVFAVQECNTVFPGEVEDFFRKSATMQAYFRRVVEAEEAVFGRPRLGPTNARHLAIRMGDLNRLSIEEFGPALTSDVYVVFGSSFIRGPLADFLVARQALNIHMGTSPYYRGSSCNFWALYDRRADYVGATVHLLSKGLDSGPMLFHALPKAEPVDPFLLGMLAVKAAREGLLEYLSGGGIGVSSRQDACGTCSGLEPVPQDRSFEHRCMRNADFTDEVAAEYLERLPSPTEVGQMLSRRDERLFLRPYIAGGTADGSAKR